MLQQSSPKRNRYQEQRQARINQAISSLEIGADPWGVFAVVPSTTKKYTVYVVNIEEGKAVKCNCPGNKEYGRVCVHLIATDYYLDALVEDAESVAIEDAQAVAFAEYDVVGAALQVVNQYEADTTVGDAYEILAPTKQVSSAAYGTCGHLVKPGHEHEMCGGCYQRMYM